MNLKKIDQKRNTYCGFLKLVSLTVFLSFLLLFVSIDIMLGIYVQFDKKL